MNAVVSGNKSHGIAICCAGMSGAIDEVPLPDLLQLFGFPTMLEKEWHKLLMTVQGVGAKASMAILALATRLDDGSTGAT